MPGQLKSCSCAERKMARGFPFPSALFQPFSLEPPPEPSPEPSNRTDHDSELTAVRPTTIRSSQWSTQPRFGAHIGPPNHDSELTAVCTTAIWSSQRYAQPRFGAHSGPPNHESQLAAVRPSLGSSQSDGVFGELGFISVERFRDRVADLPAQRVIPFGAAQRPKL